MGSATSTLKSTPPLSEKAQAPIAPARSTTELSALLRQLSLKEETSSGGNVSSSDLDNWSSQFSADPKNVFASTVISQTDLSTLTRRQAKVADAHVFNVKIPREGTPVTNQKSSGRCWLFATTNVLRLQLMKKLNLSEFQFSQSYLFFYDSLSKADYFLENMIDLAGEPLDSRTVQYLFEMPENDGGQWDMVVNLVEKFGLVPQDVYPESYHSSATGKLDTFLTSKLREFALELRKLYADAAAVTAREFYHLSPAARHKLAAEATRSRKTEQMADIYRILAITLGEPPSPTDTFKWSYYDANGKAHTISQTPLDMYFKTLGAASSSSVSLINDPRNAYETAYTVARLGNVWGGHPVRYLNCNVNVLKFTAIALLSAGEPVWFGCDVGQFMNSAEGILDPAALAYDEAFSTSVKLTKEQRLATGDSSMTHAMVLTAVHMDAGRPVRWRIENSWGPDANKNGYFVMTDAWFSEFVYQVVADRSYIDPKLLEIFDKSEPVVLPPWDPMGSLA